MKLPSSEDVDPFARHRSFYSRAEVHLPVRSHTIPIFNYVAGDTVPGTDDKATEVDTNLPLRRFPPCRFVFVAISVEVIRPVLDARIASEGLRRTWFTLKVSGIPAFEKPMAMVPKTGIEELRSPQMPALYAIPGEAQIYLNVEPLSGFWRRLKRRLTVTPSVDLRIWISGLEKGRR